MRKDEIIRRLEGDNIEDVISAIDFVVDEFLLFEASFLRSLEKNKDYRPFIAERIYKLIYKSKNDIRDAYEDQGETDSDLRFWLGSLLIAYDKNENVILDIFNHVANNEDDKEMLGLNILLDKKAAKVEDIIIEKLRKIVFAAEYYDRISFYLEKLKALNFDLPKDISEKIDDYNENVQFNWQVLMY
jgi:hypothetical protein